MTVRQGREKLHSLNAATINEIADRWINHYDRPRVDALSVLKTALEDNPMNRPSFVYTSYIDTTPEQLWKALTRPEFTQRYWNLSFQSTWEVGAPITWEHHGVTIEDPEQVVLESDPFRRLSYTWHSFTPEWAAAYGFDEDKRVRMASASRTRAAFDIEPVDDQAKLTVVHDNFDEDSLVASLVSEGWPHVISSLKTFIESGELAEASD